MILRPVRPQSPIGPPITKRPVGLTRKFLTASSRRRGRAGSTGRSTCSNRSGLISVSASMPSACWVEIRIFSISTGLAVLVADGDLRLAVGAQVGQHLALAHLGEPLGELVRERDRQRHQLLGLVGGVAEHHPLVARAGDVELVVVGRVVARLVGRVDALGDVRRLLVDRVDHRAGVAVEAEVGVVVVADLAHRLARDLLDVDVGVGRDLPETTTRPVLTSVSQATRP